MTFSQESEKNNPNPVGSTFLLSFSEEILQVFTSREQKVESAKEWKISSLIEWIIIQERQGNNLQYIMI